MSDKPFFGDINENIKAIEYNIGEARVKSGREHDDIRVMAVTKTVPTERVNYAIRRGFTLLGENRVQEYLGKRDAYDKSAEIQFIGHLQSNKVKYIINDVSLIQSVDSISLAKEIARLAQKNSITMNILCEVNIGLEDSKTGFSPDNIKEAVYQLSEIEGIKIKGLMTIPPPQSSNVYLKRMQRLYSDMRSEHIPNVDMDILSMGMSGDYFDAVLYGSNMLRIGSALFGARNYTK